MKKFEFLEHTSDVYVAAYGRSLKEAYENVAYAMFQTMTELDSVKPETKVEVAVEGDDEESLLYNWLESLLIKFEVDELLFSKFKIKELERLGKFRLAAEAYGEQYDPEMHISKVAIKAVTYHGMEIKKDKEQIVVKVLFDI